MLLLLVGIAYAEGLSEEIDPILPSDLSNFPEMFIENGNFNAVIVVGDKAPASDVVAQSNLAQFFVQYTDKLLIGSAKLSSEIDTLDQNIISIGSACHNNISWEIMVQPKQCDRWLEPGKAFIILYDYRGYVHMVIAGYSDKGTRDAVDYLTRQKKGSLSGSSILIDIDEPKLYINESKEKIVEDGDDNITVDIEKEKEELVSELNKKVANKSKEASENAMTAIPNKTKENVSSEQKQAIKADKKETSMIKRILNWLASLFK